jgi:type IV pilus assembly protein PilV
MNNKRRPIDLTRQGGATLIEILVSVVIISIGLLGLAAMQNASLRISYESYLRSQANFLAYDLIDRIRANPDAPVYEMTVDATVFETDCFASNSSGCTQSELREFDLYHWREQARELLPDAQVEVTYDDSQQLYSLRIKWQDRLDVDVQEGDSAGDNISDETKEFVYHFKVDNS